jgi:hypothetical protein
MATQLTEDFLDNGFVVVRSAIDPEIVGECVGEI